MEFITPQPTRVGPAEWFTGEVWFDVVHAGREPSRMRVNMVRFAPGAHTFWHHHVLGQTLHVVAGAALVGTRDGVVFEAHPGETVTCPPGEEHWHGATPERFMEHLALWEGSGEGAVETTWLEAVTDEQYHAPRTRRS
ncbi:cupin domain-containing protein [Nocardiopsis sp. MG754419]|uniref:(R)-mandelonitrile lyase n=1 Tax=Nocardiopsis sp. MG754419 TaxID=2259865 RepID=UPI001BA88A8F|nr:cupin domain-containing protein [Nocardiopsis sp. MG754419]MBR8745128.1 cupin domain-containing protein [Nocardiopsis sp. MG754419]